MAVSVSLFFALWPRNTKKTVAETCGVKNKHENKTKGGSPGFFINKVFRLKPCLRRSVRQNKKTQPLKENYEAGFAPLLLIQFYFSFLLKWRQIFIKIRHFDPLCWTVKVALQTLNQQDHRRCSLTYLETFKLTPASAGSVSRMQWLSWTSATSLRFCA